MGLSKNQIASEEVGELEVHFLCRARGYTGLCSRKERFQTFQIP